MGARGRWRASATAVAALVLLVPLALAGCAPPAAEEGAVVPRPDSWPVLEGQLTAEQVIDSVGVNIHLGFTDTAYGEYDAIVRPRLLESGIRHVRDALDTSPGVDGDSLYYQRVRDLGEQGIGFTLISDLATEFGPATDHDLVGEVQRWSGGAVEAVEGVNEPGHRELPDWAERTRANQVALADAVRDDPSLAGVEVIAPSILTEDNAALLGDLGPWSDFGNIHNYVGDARPEVADEAGSLGYQRREIGHAVVPDQPVLSTENGYFTSPREGEGDRTDAGLSERAAGIYVPRLLLHQVDSGVPRTYLYELLSQADVPNDPEANFGLVRPDGSVTPAFNAVASLLDLMETPAGAAASEPGDPEVSWRVTGATDDLVQVPIRLSRDAFVLALWRDVDVWEREADRDLPPDPAPVTARAPGHRVAGLAQQADDGTFVVQSAAGPRVAVDGSVTLLRFER